MDGSGLKHRQAALFAVDMAGYSRMMARDDRATVAALGAAFEDQGAQTVKNISDPVHAYRVPAQGGAASGPSAADTEPPPTINPPRAHVERKRGRSRSIPGSRESRSHHAATRAPANVVGPSEARVG